MKKEFNFKDEHEFKMALAQAIEDMNKSDMQKSLEKLIPTIYTLAIMGAANSIMLKELKKWNKDGKKKKNIV